MGEQQISVMLDTSDYRGDHSTDVQIAVALREGETVVELAKRLLIDGQKFTNKIEIRLVRP